MKKILLLTAMIVAGMMVTSCSNDDEQVNTDSQTGVIALKAEVVPMNTLLEGDRSGVSRAITAEYENTINDIHIVAFDSNGNRIYHIYSPMYAENPYTTLLNLGEAYKGQTVTIYAIANVGHADLFTQPQYGSNYTKSEFEQLNVRPYNDFVDNITDGNLVLKSGGGTELAVISNSQSPIMVTGPLQVTVANNGLTSAVLRFIRQDTKVTLNIVPQKLKILEYKICNVPKISYLFSHSENVANVQYDNLSAITIPEEDQSKTLSKVSFHVFENYNAASSNVIKQTDRYTGNVPENATYVDIIGTPDGYTGRYRYRVYLGGVDSENVIRYEYFTLLRNYEYYLTVKIAGDGTGDPRVTKLADN